MKKLAVVLIAFVAVMLIAPAAFAQGTAPEKAPLNPSYLAIAAGFGMGIAALGGALGQGKIAGAACEGMARNPGAAGAVRAAMILGLVFVETLSLFTFVVAILLYLKM
jgi:F-type H+-transporting ATPase subunit c